MNRKPIQIWIKKFIKDKFLQINVSLLPVQNKDWDSLKVSTKLRQKSELKLNN